MLWFKAFHLIFMVTWFAGLFYLPRLFVYHAMAQDTTSLERFKIMERKLLWGIATPGAILTLLLGTAMIIQNPSYLHLGWLHAKLTLIFLLIIYHVFCVYYAKQFKQDNNQRSHVFFRWFNEIPVFILIGTVLLAVIRPF